MNILDDGTEIFKSDIVFKWDNLLSCCLQLNVIQQTWFHYSKKRRLVIACNLRIHFLRYGAKIAAH